MKFRTTLILLLLAGGMFAYIKFYDSKRPTTRDAMRDSRKVTDLERDKISSITIKNAEGEIELRKSETGLWMMEKPLKDRADSLAVNGLFTAAESLNFDAVIGEDKAVEKDQLKEFGLSNAATKVVFSGAEKPVEILIGKDAAVEGKLYVKLADEKKVYVIPGDLKTLITKKSDDFRDRKLSELTSSQISKATIKTASGEIDVEKKNDHWTLTKPFKARGDDARIGDVLSQAVTARIDSFVADGGSADAHGLQEPRATISLYSEGSTQPVVLQIGANTKDEPGKEKTYAKLSSRDSVVVLPKTIDTLLEVKPNDLRDKNLARIEADIVDRINIEAAGNDKIVLARKGESWVRKGTQDVAINVAEANRLLNDLKSQQVSKFEADVSTELPKYGLEQPAVKVTLSSYASENTSETKAGEKPIATILFGKTEGDSVFAKLEDEPFIVTVPKQLAESIPTDPLQWQDLVIYKLKPEEITSLEITRQDQPAISIEREKDKWKLSKGDGSLNQVNVQSLVNTLSNLHAIRWTGAMQPEHGFDKPAVTIKFQAANNVTGQLTVGAVAPDETWFASAEGFSGTFILNRPDQEALVLPLIDKPTSATTPAVAPPPAAVTPAPAASQTLPVEVPPAPATPQP